jgi:DNA polymerase-3 subunit beta
MRFELPRKELQEALRHLKDALPLCNKAPIFDNTLIDANGALSFSATDHERFLTMMPPAAKIMETGKTAVPVKILIEMTKRLAGEAVMASVVDGSMDLKSGGATLRLPTHATEGFPSPLRSEMPHSYAVPADLFAAAIEIPRRSSSARTSSARTCRVCTERAGMRSPSTRWTESRSRSRKSRRRSPECRR